LEPDIVDHLRALHEAGVGAVVVVPLGFISDHMEVVYDLDTEATAIAAEVGLPVTRAATPGTDPRFVRMVIDLVDERRGGAMPVALGPKGPRPMPCAGDCCPAG
jgi:ferrochelatase